MTQSAVSPEDRDTRLTRAEERLRTHEKLLEALGPLISQYARLDERLEGLRGDLNDGLDALRREIAEMKKDASERAKERRTMLVALFIAGVGLFGTFGAQLMQLRGR